MEAVYQCHDTFHQKRRWMTKLGYLSQFQGAVYDAFDKRKAFEGKLLVGDLFHVFSAIIKHPLTPDEYTVVSHNMDQFAAVVRSECCPLN